MPVLWQVLKREVLAGGRAFVVFPLVEKSEVSPDVRAATDEFELLTDLEEGMLGDISVKCGLVHGRMSQTEKEAAMADFQAGRTQVRRAL